MIMAGERFGAMEARQVGKVLQPRGPGLPA